MISHEYFMQRALNMAKKAKDNGEVPIGAIIIKGEEIIAQSHNQVVTLKDATAHAEILAITQASAHFNNERLNGCTLYVTIEPCPMCVGAAVMARLDGIVFGAYDSKSGACGSRVELTKPGLFNHDLKVKGGVMDMESRDIIQEFFLSKR